jgi:glycosyltransferase involved in cell wall biosynthesis
VTGLPTISIVTAAYNCASQLPRLIASLAAQTDRQFEWVVADGASTDGTLELLRSVEGLTLVLSSQRDFGIYDALNRAIELASGEYYVVVGADDVLDTDAIANYRRAFATSGADIIAARVRWAGRYKTVQRGPMWLHGAHSFIANHSLASAFRRRLHDKFGRYSPKFPIAADALFVLQACRGGASRYEADFVAGEIGADGVSTVDWAGGATEFFRVQLIAGCWLPLQVLLLLLRLLKGASSSVRGVVNGLR